MEIAHLGREAVPRDGVGSGYVAAALKAEMETENGPIEIVEDLGNRGLVGDLESKGNVRVV
jgi:hypothetical protein